ncbi:hypothetical protein HPB48_024566 [Haemaphysalis longicornis]|uniref:Hexosyltransferase n=1 Tax=Haemaphysalis longicornis TaxID=44386 RepID=A0A9J6GY56_HAELO|nr:hypothetical protein HPB48_024566 [Haemaphysalis longicornis]
MGNAIGPQCLAAGRWAAAVTCSLLASVRRFKIQTRRKAFFLVASATGLLLFPVAFLNTPLGPLLQAIVEPTTRNRSFFIPSSLKLSVAKPNFSETNAKNNSGNERTMPEQSGANKIVFTKRPLGPNAMMERNGDVTAYTMDSARPGGEELYSMPLSSVNHIFITPKFRKATSPNATSNVSATVTPTAISVKQNSRDKPTKEFGWKVKCACVTSLRVLYYVHTAPENTQRRQLLRSTIGNREVAAFVNSSLVFFVGTTPDLKLREEVHTEAEEEGDVVELDFLDTYRNLTHKFIGATKWLKANQCLNSLNALS